MKAYLESDESLSAIHHVLEEALERVQTCFDTRLRSELPPVRELCEHVKTYRGKMLRPTLTILCGLAARAGDDEPRSADVTDRHVLAAAVCEMIHMATLVHDDVLDEAETRRGGVTLNRLRGNEASVILGDYLIAAAYHLCSQIGDQRISLLVSEASMALCEGELLQLHHRDDYSLDELTYFEIVERKTASLIALACRVGAILSGADDGVSDRLALFGTRLGVAFQVQDDLLDLAGEAAVVGKPLARDVESGKLTLALIHHLQQCQPIERGRTLRLLERAGAHGPSHGEHAGAILDRLALTNSIAYARGIAEQIVADSMTLLEGLPESAAKRLLANAARHVVDRAK